MGEKLSSGHKLLVGESYGGCLLYTLSTFSLGPEAGFGIPLSLIQGRTCHLSTPEALVLDMVKPFSMMCIHPGLRSQLHYLVHLRENLGSLRSIATPFCPNGLHRTAPWPHC